MKIYYICNINYTYHLLSVTKFIVPEPARPVNSSLPSCSPHQNLPPAAPCADRGNGERRFVAARSSKALKVIHPIFEPGGAVAIPVTVRQAGRHGKSVTECDIYYELLLSAGAAPP